MKPEIEEIACTVDLGRSEDVTKFYLSDVTIFVYEYTKIRIVKKFEIKNSDLSGRDFIGIVCWFLFLFLDC